MRFWDSSAIVPLVVREDTSAALRRMVDEEAAMAVWWATPVECVSAIARRERAEHAGSETATAALATLADLASSWVEVSPTDVVRDDARRLVRVHDLRAADAFQLAAARVAADGQPGTQPLVTLDERLALAASREGFRVLGSGQRPG